MIRIARGPEPDPLRKKRYQLLPRAILTMDAHSGALPKNFDFSGYEDARGPLYWVQHQKCAYCERPQGEMEQPREHFRPKDGAQRVRHATSGAGAALWDPDVYWWLAWTWENLLFSCKTCNGTSHKGNYFPIDGAPLSLLDFDLRHETSLIVDPCRDDPLDHVRWVPLASTLPRDQWEWSPVAVGPKGGATIDAFQMRSQDFLPQVSRAIQREVIPELTMIEDEITSGQEAHAAQRWQALQDRCLYPGAIFVGARWSALVFLRDLPGSPLASLPEPLRPGRHDPWVLPVGYPSAPAGIPDPAWIRLLAGEQLDEALILILFAAPLTVKELWSRIRVDHSQYQPTKPVLREKLDTLVAAGRLRERGDRFEVTVPAAAASAPGDASEDDIREMIEIILSMP